MIFVLFYLLRFVVLALVVGAAVTIYISFFLLAVLTAVFLALIRSFINWRWERPKRPKFKPPVPQSRYSNRR